MKTPNLASKAIWLVLSLAALWPAAAAEAVISPIGAPPSVGTSVLRMIGAFCLVMSLLFAGVWAYRNSGRFAGARGRAAKLRVLETRSLGNRHSICVVAYEQQRILLSTSPTGVTMLTHLPEAPLEEAAPDTVAAGAPLPNFSAAFMQALAGARK